MFRVGGGWGSLLGLFCLSWFSPSRLSVSCACAKQVLEIEAAWRPDASMPKCFRRGGGGNKESQKSISQGMQGSLL